MKNDIIETVWKRGAGGSCGQPKIKEELEKQLEKLPTELQKQVLDFPHELVHARHQGVPGKQLLAFAGTIPEDVAMS